MSFLKEVTGAEVVFLRKLISFWLFSCEQGEQVGVPFTALNVKTAESIDKKIQSLVEKIAMRQERFSEGCKSCDTKRSRTN